MRHFLILMMAVLLTGPSFAQAPAAKPDSKPKAEPDPRAALVKKFDGIALEDVRMSPVPGVYEIARGAEISYVTADGKFAFVGDLVDIDGNANVSEKRRQAIRSRLIDAIPASEMLVFAPKDPKYVITVFTDIDCGYCRRMHSQIAEYNKLGIGVRYLFFPRTGPDTDSWRKAEAVWCSKDRNDAFTRAKSGEELKAAKCSTDIVKRDFELARKLQVDGTPSIFLPSGELFPYGYRPPAQLLRYLKTGRL